MVYIAVYAEIFEGLIFTEKNFRSFFADCQIDYIFTASIQALKFCTHQAYTKIRM